MKQTLAILVALLLSPLDRLHSADAPPVSKIGVTAQHWIVFESSFTSTRKYDNPFLDVQVDVVFRQDDKQWRVPTFWAGGDKWTVRFAPPIQGQYTYHVECTDKNNPDLNRKEQTLSVGAYSGDNPLLKHGFLRVAEDKRHFEHADNTPFLWLGDTWWKNLCKRMTWEHFQELSADRKAKGLSTLLLANTNPHACPRLKTGCWSLKKMN